MTSFPFPPHHEPYGKNLPVKMSDIQKSIAKTFFLERLMELTKKNETKIQVPIILPARLPRS